jgi:lipopolysaccharide/colanic/teichoic acid biosynthesis glycosyltransferase
MKRAFDVLVSFIVLVLFFPIGLMLAFLIVIESKGGVFYYQERVGQNQQLFSLIKFRSMRINADLQGQLTVGSRDSRITKVGFFIRKFKLDEFPQFINVLKGDMSIVGPRPEVPKYVALYTEQQLKVLTVKPGITDYASIAYFHENEILAQAADPEKAYIEEVMPAKIQLNQRYLAKPTLSADLKIMLLTFLKMLGR